MACKCSNSNQQHTGITRFNRKPEALKFDGKSGFLDFHDGKASPSLKQSSSSSPLFLPLQMCNKHFLCFQGWKKSWSCQILPFTIWCCAILHWHQQLSSERQFWGLSSGCYMLNSHCLCGEFPVCLGKGERTPEWSTGRNRGTITLFCCFCHNSFRVVLWL